MFPNLVSYHIFQQPPLPPFDAQAYQYILAGNGLHIRADTAHFHACIPISYCQVRGLPHLQSSFQLKIPRLPAQLLTAILADARRACRSDGELNETLYLLYRQQNRIQVVKPAQQGTPTSVTTTALLDESPLCELHTHGGMPAFFSTTDDADEQACRLYGVLGQVDSRPEMCLRVGIYGHWYLLPLTALFEGNAGIMDCHTTP